jgi:hypothetical protein
VVQQSLGRLARIVAAVAATLFASASVADSEHEGAGRHAGQYSITTPAFPLIGFASSGTVTVDVAGPSARALKDVRLLLNGKDVTASLQSAATAGTLTGSVSGLQQGSNTFELLESGESRHAVAQLVVERATTVANAATACAALMSIPANQFPIQPSAIGAGTMITLAKLNAAGSVTVGTTPLPEHCQVQGLLRTRTGVSGVPGTSDFGPQQYATKFEVRLPTQWNGRYMFQGGGGTEGALPSATGSQTGTASYPELVNGWAVASQDGGHESSQLPATAPATATSPSILQVNMFFPDAQAVKDWAYNAIDMTTQTAKFLIDTYYGRKADRNYFVGCSTSGRQAMAFSQNFPTYYDGIIAGDPFYLPPDISLSETWGLEQIISAAPTNPDGSPNYLGGWPLSDQNLFTNAILAACDANDGLVDGVIDDLPGCHFNPATFVFPTSGPYGSIAPGQPLQCTGAKTATCLSAAQVKAINTIVDGPRTARGQRITSPDGTLLSGYPFDGGFMQPLGIPTRDIGTATTPPGNIGLGTGQLPLFWFTVPDPNLNPLTFNYNTEIGLVTASSPAVNKSPDIEAFLDRGGKMIFFHGLSDSGPPWPYTLKYINEEAARHGGLAGLARYMKLYLVPNMGHCGGNAATDQFDMLTPMVNWIENASPPASVVASGKNFSASLGTLSGLPTTRSRPLCPYPESLRYSGPAGGDISVASNYTCGNHGSITAPAAQLPHGDSKEGSDD